MSLYIINSEFQSTKYQYLSHTRMETDFYLSELSTKTAYQILEVGTVGAPSHVQPNCVILNLVKKSIFLMPKLAKNQICHCNLCMQQRFQGGSISKILGFEGSKIQDFVISSSSIRHNQCLLSGTALKSPHLLPKKVSEAVLVDNSLK